MSDKKYNLDSLFEAACEIESTEQRDAFLEEACGGDAQLRQRVERLLQAEKQVGSFLNKPPEALKATFASDASDDERAASLHAGLALSFNENAAVILGDINHSVLESLGETINEIPRVMLKEPSAESDAPVQRPSSAELPARSVGRYQLQGEIARGGMGAIIKGRDTDLGRDLAVKVLLDEHKAKPEMVQRFVEEAQIGGQLQHPGIAPVYELGQFTDQRPFFSMKLVKGETLSKLLADRKASTADRGKFLGIFEQICQTMAYAHSRGVIHRDLKPSNIMVGSFGEVQVMDWGLSKVLSTGGIADEKKSRDQTQGQSVIQTLRSAGSEDPGSFASTGSDTAMGSVMGTPAYMPPEQALGEIDNMDERADVFALGAILCEILTGSPPYIGDDGNQIHRLASRGKLDECFIRLDASAADTELIDLAKRCLGLEPADRPRDAGVLAGDITEYLESVETKLRESELERVADSTRQEEERKRRRVSLAFATSVLLMLGLAAGGWLYVERREANRQALIASNQAEHALAMDRERLIAEDAKRLAETRLEDVTLASAFSAFNTGNIEKAREFLDRMHLVKDDPRRIAASFLTKRCSEQVAETIEIESGSSFVDLDPLGEFLLVTSRDANAPRIALSSYDEQREMLLEIDTNDAEENVKTHLVSISDDGRWLIAVREVSEGRAEVLVWELIRGQRRISAKRLEAVISHDSPIRDVDVNSTTERIATIGYDGLLKLWQLPSGNLITHKQTGHSVPEARFSPDGSEIATYGWESDKIVLCDGESLAETRSLYYGGRLCKVRYFPTGSMIAATGYVGTKVFDLTLETQHPVNSVDWRRAFRMSVSLDGKMLALFHPDDRSIAILDAESGHQIARHQPGVGSPMIFDANDRLLFVQRGLRRMNLRTAANRSHKTSGNWFAPFATANRHSKIAFSGENATIKILDVSTGQSTPFGASTNKHSIQAIAYSEDGSRIAVAKGIRPHGGKHKDTLELWNVDSKQIEQSFLVSPVRMMKFSPINQNLLVVGGANSTRIVDFSSETERVRHIASGRAISIEMSLDGSRLIVGGSVGWGGGPYTDASIWRVDDKGIVSLIDQLPSKVTYSSAITRNGRILACIDLSKDSIYLWDIEKRKQYRDPIKLSSARVMSLDFSPNDECLVVSSPGGEITFLDYKQGKEIGTYRLDRPFRHIKFLDSCNRIVVSTMDGEIMQWDY